MYFEPSTGAAVIDGELTSAEVLPPQPVNTTETDNVSAIDKAILIKRLLN
jgi:hypothetical protein